MASRVVARLLVIPNPATLSESTAIYKALCAQTNNSITAFARLPRDWGRALSASSTHFYVLVNDKSLFENAHKDGIKFAVNSDQPRLQDEDNFNIRGVQDRKPYPPSRTFQCLLYKYRGPTTIDNNPVSQDSTVTQKPPHHAPALGNIYQEPYLAHSWDLFRTLHKDLEMPSVLRPAMGEPVTRKELDEQYNGSIHNFLLRESPNKNNGQRFDARGKLFVTLSDADGVDIALFDLHASQSPTSIQPRLIDADTEAMSMIAHTPEGEDMSGTQSRDVTKSTDRSDVDQFRLFTNISSSTTAQSPED